MTIPPVALITQGMEQLSIVDVAATVCFALAILHTFSVKRFQHAATLYPDGSVGENFFHLIGEVEVVFGVWAAVFLMFVLADQGPHQVVNYLNGLNFTEPAFVFVIMSVCSTRPILKLASGLIDVISKLIPLPKGVSFFVTALVIGPLLGSLITEPAAMTVTALILLQRMYSSKVSYRLKYATLGLLFVNISIGGTLTHFAAPPVLMVAPQWGWDTPFMLYHFGWKGALACLLSTVITAAIFYKELSGLKMGKDEDTRKTPIWVVLLHILTLSIVVLSAHYMVVFMGIFLFFLGLVTVTKEYQDELKLKEGMLVAFFLGGLVILGKPQQWWLEPLLSSMDAHVLYVGTAMLTAITDNAALTYLGSQVPNLSDASKYALVGGAVVGGGLTVIANAPNPAGYGILNASFGKEGISPFGLFISALGPTLVAGVFFWFF